MNEIRNYITRRESFAFETTLSGKGYISMIQKMLADGWDVNVFYLWLPDVQIALNRVAERVRHGGHDIPRDAVIRRYSRSISNLLNIYAPLCSYTLCLDNSSSSLTEIFEQDDKGRHYIHRDSYQRLMQEVKSSHAE